MTETNNLYHDFNSVKELNKQQLSNSTTLKKLVDKNHGGFIMFYAPWCPHCRIFAELWNYLAIQFKYQWVISAFNCANPGNEPTCQKYNIDRYPTILELDTQGNTVPYRGAMDKDGLMKYIYNKLL